MSASAKRSSVRMLVFYAQYGLDGHRPSNEDRCFDGAGCECIRNGLLWFPPVPPFKGLLQLCSCHSLCLQWCGVVSTCCVLHPLTVQELPKYTLLFVCVCQYVCVNTSAVRWSSTCGWSCRLYRPGVQSCLISHYNVCVVQTCSRCGVCCIRVNRVRWSDG